MNNREENVWDKVNIYFHRYLLDVIRWSNIRVVGVLEGEQIENWAKNFEKIMADNFPNLMKGTNLQSQDAQQTAKRVKHKDCHTDANC